MGREIEGEREREGERGREREREGERARARERERERERERARAGAGVRGGEGESGRGGGRELGAGRRSLTPAVAAIIDSSTNLRPKQTASNSIASRVPHLSSRAAAVADPRSRGGRRRPDSDTATRISWPKATSPKPLPAHVNLTSVCVCVCARARAMPRPATP